MAFLLQRHRPRKQVKIDCFVSDSIHIEPSYSITDLFNAFISVSEILYVVEGLARLQNRIGAGLGVKFAFHRYDAADNGGAFI